MARRTLFIFIGKPGVGKTTLIKEIFPAGQIVDVRPFVRRYEVAGHVPEEKTLDGYRDMYRHLREQDRNSEVVILELGTNHAEFNIKELEQLGSIFHIYIFLLDASVETCRQRFMHRHIDDDIAAMERRLQRDFPKTHLDLLAQSALPFQLVDMEQPLAETSRSIKEYISKI